MQSNRRHEPRHHESRRFARRVRRRFWAALALTVPILLLSPPIQGVLGIEEALQRTVGAESRSEHPMAQGVEIPEGRYEDLSGQGKTVVFVLIDSDLAGAIPVAAGVLVG